MTAMTSSQIIAPTLQLKPPDGRDYLGLLSQTKMVYDQLLADRCGKMNHALWGQKQQYDTECNRRATSGDQAKALEYGVRAQETLNRMRKQHEKELLDLREDYQEKLIKMYRQLEEKWQEDHGKGSVKIYPRK